MTDSPDRTLENVRIDAKLLSEITEIMSRNGRRVVIKLDDQKIDSLASVTPAAIGAAKEVDVSSFWVNPDREHFGRRHFVYFLAGPGGARYFGDSISPEVVRVCEDLDVYFGRVTAATGAAGTVSNVNTGWRPRGWVFETKERFVAAACLAGLLIGLFGFLIGRWTAPSDVYVIPSQPSAVPAEVRASEGAETPTQPTPDSPAPSPAP